MHIIFQILVGIIAMCMIAGAVDTKELTYLALIVSDFLTLHTGNETGVNTLSSIAVPGVLSGNGRIVVNLDIGDFYDGNITIKRRTNNDAYDFSLRLRNHQGDSYER